VSEPDYFTAPKSGWYTYGISAIDPSGESADIQGITFDSVPGAFSLPETCCVCGSPDIAYHNYRDLLFCQRCADPPYRTPWKRRLALAIKALRGIWP